MVALLLLIEISIGAGDLAEGGDEDPVPDPLAPLLVERVIPAPRSR